jgi:hypothetical protein
VRLLFGDKEFLRREYDSNLIEIEKIVGAESEALKRTMLIIPPFSFFHGLLLQLLWHDNPNGGKNMINTGTVHFTKMRGKKRLRKLYVRKVEDFIENGDVSKLQKIGITPDNAGKYFDYATGGETKEIPSNLKRRCSYSLGCYYNLESIQFGEKTYPLSEKTEYLGRDLDHSRPTKHGGSDEEEKNRHHMCGYHNRHMKNMNPLFDEKTLYNLFFGPD